jgi:hypothetical protein
MTRRPTIIPRTPIFLGCEGQSEVGYGALLNRLVRELAHVHLHIHVEVLQSGETTNKKLPPFARRELVRHFELQEGLLPAPPPARLLLLILITGPAS